MKAITLAATILASITTVQATGVAMIQNLCPFDVFIKSVSQGPGWSDAQAPTRIKSLGSWVEPLRIVGAGTKADGGVAIKMSRWENDFRHITQLEYTLDGRVWYDGSNVDCGPGNCPFQNYGMSLLATDRSCRSPRCGSSGCSPDDIYLKWNDDNATKDCQANSDLIMYLCNDNWGGARKTKREFSA
jgi:hypothetical protein